MYGATRCKSEGDVTKLTGWFGVLGHVRAFLRRDMSRRGKAEICLRSPRKVPSRTMERSLRTMERGLRRMERKQRTTARRLRTTERWRRRTERGRGEQSGGCGERSEGSGEQSGGCGQRSGGYGEWRDGRFILITTNGHYVPRCAECKKRVSKLFKEWGQDVPTTDWDCKSQPRSNFLYRAALSVKKE